MTTPYDTTMAGVFWSGKSVGEKSIGQVVTTVKSLAPNMTSIFVKTSDGADWQGRYDSANPGLTMSGPGSLANWVNTAGVGGIQIHAWCVLKGIDVGGEAQRVIEACSVPGVRSMLLDIEDGAGYFSGGASNARQVIQAIRRGIPADFHLALIFDARGQHPKHIFIEEWLPHVQSVHPMIYHAVFGLDVRAAIVSGFSVTKRYGKPIIPMLQAFDGVPPAEIADAGRTAFQQGAAGISYYRLGAIGPREFAALKTVERPAIIVSDGGPVVVDPDPARGDAVIVRPGRRRYREGQYRDLTADQAWQEFVDVHGWTVRYRRTSPVNLVYASYRPRLPAAGRYAIEVFVPSSRADTQAAAYHIAFYRDGQRLERKVSLDQSIYSDEWASLGSYKLDPAVGDSGRVNLVDYSLEDPPRWISFSAVRWRPVRRPDPPAAPAVADGFDGPVGTAQERAGRQLWPGLWKDAWHPATGYAKRYRDSAGVIAYHTGADLNLNEPRFNLDRGAPVHAIASGRVAFAGRVGDYWRNIIIVEHDPLPDGTKMCSRYAHVEGIQVSAEERVARGQLICYIGSSGGPNGNYHLHLDISPTDILVSNPGQWPRTKLDQLLANYVDPILFIRGHRP